MATIRLSTLNSMTPSERNEKLMSVVADAHRSGASADKSAHREVIDSKLKKLEGRYEMSSSTMRHDLSKGRLKETAEICSWLLLLKQRESLETESSTARPKSVSELLQNP